MHPVDLYHKLLDLIFGKEFPMSDTAEDRMTRALITIAAIAGLAIALLLWWLL